MADQPVAFIVFTAGIWGWVEARNIHLPAEVAVEWLPDTDGDPDRQPVLWSWPLLVYNVYADGHIEHFAQGYYKQPGSHVTFLEEEFWSAEAGPHLYGYSVSHHRSNPDDPYNAPAAVVPAQDGSDAPRTYIDWSELPDGVRVWKLYPTEADRTAGTNGVEVTGWQQAAGLLFPSEPSLYVRANFYPYLGALPGSFWTDFVDTYEEI